MDHGEFRESLDAIRRLGVVMFALSGQQYCGSVGNIWLDAASCAVDMPALFVKNDADESWAEHPNLWPTYFTFNWLDAEYFWVTEANLVNGKFCIMTNEGPMYILLRGEEAV